MEPVALHLLKTFTNVHTILYEVRRQVMGPDLLQVLKTFSNVHTSVWSEAAGDGTGCTTTAENIYQYPR
jgi:hypothetical protein